ncbi:MAG: S-methyl-5-thioribose-1-phosphate isomerase [Acidimicrobiia bacterium]|nr:S-methyl-5-thioribose-1-phosphate isomerase [Acidimicrobiia bacterium]MDQ3500224.1 S-methyl-5-thioribose-1-phosphate isomerase [Actinomycetota bacterium]
MVPLRSVDWDDGAVVIVDQTLLPNELRHLRITNVSHLVGAIKRLAVRGAPSIGVAGALGVALAARTHPPADQAQAFDDDVHALRSARPTAVNLARAVDRAAGARGGGYHAILAEGLAIRDEEIASCWSMGIYGSELLIELTGERPQRLMTICNTGGLAAVERGTALGVIQTMLERGLLAEAIPLETRPLLQGGRLTTWELARMGAPFRLIVDSAGPFLLAQGAADAVLVGADRVAANGDTANKVGSFSLALGARNAGVPFIVVAPESSMDLDTPSGEMIEIEDRGSEEVTRAWRETIAPLGTKAINPAFDITPHEMITAVVTDRRVIRLDRGEKLSEVPLGPLRTSHRRSAI